MVVLNSFLNTSIVSFGKSKSQPQSSPNGAAIVDEILSSTNIKDSKTLVQDGNAYLKKNEYDKAIDCYKQSIDLRPEFSDTYYQLGKAYKGKEDYPNAISSLETYLKGKDQDVEAVILLGECYNQTGTYAKAKEQFNKAMVIDPSNDYAKRNMLETNNLILSCYDPITAMKEKRVQAINNLNQALDMAKGYLSTGYFKDMADVSIAFDKTAKLGGTSNIAQYEHSKRKITVTDTYVYAAPQIVSAYLVHEFVHAKDKDSYTSVREEQDAYNKATEFWLDNSKGIKDPEMDYAADLYKQSPQTLSNRVEEIYKLRDPNIAMTSPNHPSRSKKISAQNLTQLNSGQPISNYDVIS